MPKLKRKLSRIKWKMKRNTERTQKGDRVTCWVAAVGGSTKETSSHFLFWNWLLRQAQLKLYENPEHDRVLFGCSSSDLELFASLPRVNYRLVAGATFSEAITFFLLFCHCDIIHSKRNDILGIFSGSMQISKWVLSDLVVCDFRGTDWLDKGALFDFLLTTLTTIYWNSIIWFLCKACCIFGTLVSRRQKTKLSAHASHRPWWPDRWTGSPVVQCDGSCLNLIHAGIKTPQYTIRGDNVINHQDHLSYPNLKNLLTDPELVFLQMKFQNKVIGLIQKP